MDKNTLEWQMLNYYKSCFVCKRKLIVHAYRQKPEVVYCHCANKSCKLYGEETPPHTHGKEERK